MKLADIGSPEGLADCIIAHFRDIRMPVQLMPIATALGIIEVIGQDTKGFEGVLVTHGSKTTGSIAYNKASTPERRRFTIAHELGHFLLPFHGADAQCAKTDMGVLKSKDANRAREAEANRFAASLLMPKGHFIRDIRRLKAPETSHIVTLATDYEVSKEAAARRYTDLCDHVCAVVFSHKGRVRYAAKTATFPFIVPRNDDPLPADTLSSRGRSEPGTMSEWATVDPEAWIGTAPLRGKELCEQFLEQANGYRLTMLTIDDASDEGEPDEEEELADSWTPRHRR